MAPSSVLAMENLDQMTVLGVMRLGRQLYTGSGFVRPLSKIRTSDLDQTMRIADVFQENWSNEGGEWSDFGDSGISDAQAGAQTDHRNNYSALLIMHKQGFFDDPWGAAKWLAAMEFDEEDYLKQLQRKYGAIGAGFPVQTTDPEYEYKRGNEKEVELWCLMDDCESCDAIFMKEFLLEFALKETVKKAEKQETENAKQKNEITKLVAENKKLKAENTKLNTAQAASLSELATTKSQLAKLKQQSSDRMQIAKLEKKARRKNVKERHELLGKNLKLKKREHKLKKKVQKLEALAKKQKKNAKENSNAEKEVPISTGPKAR